MTPEGRELFRAPRKTQIDSSLSGRWGRGRGRGEQLFCVKQMIELSDSPLFVETVRLLTNIVLTPSIRLGVLYWCYQIYHLVEDHLVVANMAMQWLKLLFVLWMFASPRSIYIYIDARITDYRISIEIYDQKLHQRTGLSWPTYSS